MSLSVNAFRATVTRTIDLVPAALPPGDGDRVPEELAASLHVDLVEVQREIVRRANGVASVLGASFENLRLHVEADGLSVQILSAASIASTAAEFVLVVEQHSHISRMAPSCADASEVLATVESRSNAVFESVLSFVRGQFETEDQILATFVTSRTLDAQHLLRQGWENLRNGFESEALDRFTKSIEFDNTVYLAHAVVAEILERRGSVDAAENHFRRASRFAASVGAPVANFAAIALAAFLDRSGRAAESFTVLTPAVGPQSSPSQYFFHAELAAEIGDRERSLGSLRSAMQGDPHLFLAAMGSDRLSKMGRDLRAALIDVDSSTRNAALEALRETVVTLLQTVALGGNASNPRSLIVRLFERATVAPFIELGTIIAEAQQLAKMCAAEVERLARDAAHSVTNAGAALLAHAAQAPASGNTGFAGWSKRKRQIAGIFALAAAWLMFGALALGAEEACVFTTGGVLFVLPALIVWGQLSTAGASGNRNLDDIRSSWRSWDDRFSSLETAYVHAREDLRSQLSSALQLAETRILREILHFLDGQLVPARAPQPAWLQAAAAAEPKWAVDAATKFVPKHWRRPAIVGVGYLGLCTALLARQIVQERDREAARIAAETEEAARATQATREHAAANAAILGNYEGELRICQQMLARRDWDAARSCASNLLEASPGETRAEDLLRRAEALQTAREERDRRSEEDEAQRLALIGRCSQDCWAPYRRCLGTHGSESSCSDIEIQARQCVATECGFR